MRRKYISILNDYGQFAHNLQHVEVANVGIYGYNDALKPDEEAVRKGWRRLGQKFDKLHTFVCPGATEFHDLFTNEYKSTRQWTCLNRKTLTRLEMPSWTLEDKYFDLFKSLNFTKLKKFSALESSGWTVPAKEQMQHWGSLTHLDIHHKLLDRQNIIDIAPVLPFLQILHCKVRSYDVSTVMIQFRQCTSLIIGQGVKHLNSHDEKETELEWGWMYNHYVELPFDRLSDKCFHLKVYGGWSNCIPHIMTGITKASSKSSCRLRTLEIENFEEFYRDNGQMPKNMYQSRGEKSSLQEFIVKDLITTCTNLEFLSINRVGFINFRQEDRQWKHLEDQGLQFMKMYGRFFSKLKNCKIIKCNDSIEKKRR
jgi:predicted nuclease of restriction endonuclease-like (RecB) superfamily